MFERRIERWLAIGLGALTFAVYLCTHGGGLADVQGSTHPLWLAFVRTTDAWGGVGNCAWLRSAAVALFGGAAVALVCSVMNECLSDLMCPETELGGSLNEGVGDAAEAARDTAARETCATAGAAVGASFFAFCTPFWASAASVTDGSFEVSFVMLVVWLLLRCRAFGGSEACATVMFLCGAGAADSPVLLWCVPVAFAVVVRSLILSDICSERALPLYLLSGLTGLAAGLGVFLLLSGAEDASAAVQDYVRQYCAAFSLSACRGGWALVWGVPAAVLCLSAFRLRSVAARDEGVGVAGGALLLALTATVIANALGFPHTVWPVAVKWGYVPVIPSLSLAFAAGGLFSCWLRMGLAREDLCREEFPMRASILRTVGLAACGALVIVMFRQPCLAMDEMKRAERDCGAGRQQRLSGRDGITMKRQNERKGGAVSRNDKDATEHEIFRHHTTKPK